jgi:hypothetical protein
VKTLVDELDDQIGPWPWDNAPVKSLHVVVGASENSGGGDSIAVAVIWETRADANFSDARCAQMFRQVSSSLNTLVSPKIISAQ